jgi:hypothetical protein
VPGSSLRGRIPREVNAIRRILIAHSRSPASHTPAPAGRPERPFHHYTNATFFAPKFKKTTHKWLSAIQHHRHTPHGPTAGQSELAGTASTIIQVVNSWQSTPLALPPKYTVHSCRPIGRSGCGRVKRLRRAIQERQAEVQSANTLSTCRQVQIKQSLSRQFGIRGQNNLDGIVPGSREPAELKSSIASCLGRSHYFSFLIEQLDRDAAHPGLATRVLQAIPISVEVD